MSFNNDPNLNNPSAQYQDLASNRRHWLHSFQQERSASGSHLHGTDGSPPIYIIEHNNCIGIFGIAPTTTKKTLYDIFEKNGKIKMLHLGNFSNYIIKEDTHCYGFISFKTDSSAKLAIENEDWGY